MKTGLYFTAFTVGAAVGSLITWRLVKEKYERIAQEEIDSVKDVFANREYAKEALQSGENIGEGLRDGIRFAADQAKEKPDIKEYTEMIQRAGYASTGSENAVTRHPYVITPEEFGEFDDYERISLTWYADEVLADDNDEIVDDEEDIVGDALSHFGEYEDDSVFVRCDERKCDYEILLDQRAYSDIIGNKPHPVEVR